MTRTFWPASLDALIDGPVVSQCPDCQWNRVCPSNVQAGVSMALREEQFTIADCIWFQRYQQLYRKETGQAPPEGFGPDDLAYSLAERRTLREEVARESQP